MKDNSSNNLVLFMGLLGFILFGLVTVSVPNPDPSDTATVIACASACDNHRLLSDIYQRLVEVEPLNIEYHRGFIAHRCQEFTSQDNQPGRTVDALREQYETYTNDSDPALTHIGHYGLGYIAVHEKDYEEAKKHYLRVDDEEFPYVNCSLGHVLLKQRDYENAKRLFCEEIRLEGNLDGAYANLGQALLRTAEYEELDKLLDDPAAAERVGKNCLRINHLVQGEYWPYVLYVVKIRRFNFAGLICACLVLAVWFFYLRRLDAFEPERYRDLLIVLAMGMLFTELAIPLYDLALVFLNFTVNGAKGNDLLFCIFGIGLIEETVKILPVLIMLKWSKAINESVDLVIYACVSALGFAFMENLLYFHPNGLTAVGGRALMAVLGHMSLSTIAISGLLWARYNPGRTRVPAWVCFGTTFLAACILHGVYDFFLIAEGMGLLILISPLILLFEVDQFGRIINTALNHSEFLPQKRKIVVDHSDYLVCALSGILMLEYVTLAVLYGPVNVNMTFGYRLVLLFIALLIIASHLGSFQIRPKRWTPFFGRRTPKET